MKLNKILVASSGWKDEEEKPTNIRGVVVESIMLVKEKAQSMNMKIQVRIRA